MGLDYELVVMPFPPRRHAKPYLDVNPLGTVPALVDGDVTLTESSAITQYLITRYGPTPLAVEVDEADYGLFLDFLHHADATLTFPVTVYARYRLFEAARELGEAGDLYADWFIARLIKIERRLERRSFLCSDRFTAADVAISYALHLATVLGLGERLPPSLRDYLARITERPAFRRAAELEQTITPM